MDGSLVERFESDGVVRIERALDAEWIELLRDLIPVLLATAPDADGPSISVNGMWRHFEPFARFLFDSPVGELAAGLMRSGPPRLYEDILLYKAEHTAGTDWHRDAPHWPVSGDQLSSIWFSLEPVTVATGAMSVVAGSHRDPDELVSTASIYAGGELRDRPSVTFDVEPGDVIAFHPRALHSTSATSSDQPRRSFTLRFTGDDVRWRPRRSVYHEWMRDCGLRNGDPLEHPWFPVVS